MTTYYPTIGLEIHAELKTKSKMFSPSKNDPDETTPNQNIHPIDLAHPGTLPTLNHQAIEHMVNIGLAVGGEVANFTEFDRKNYFYPDIPKGYQISQYKYPIVSGGTLGGVELTRIHLEEDTGTNKHDKGNYSLVDYNRAGIPLMELVTEPVIHDAETAGKFAKELQLLLRTLGVADANMEKGEMRVEANISISPDPNQLGTKVEVKNINSFRAVEKAIIYEIERMTQLHEAGKADEIVQETRGWDDAKGRTFSQRKKESAHDYRYFPDPDLPKLYLHDMFNLEDMKSSLPELPWEKRNRYRESYGIKDEDIESFVTDHSLGVFFENVVILLEQDKDKIKLASNYITSDLIGLLKQADDADAALQALPYADFAALIVMAHAGELNSRGAKDILAMMMLGEEGTNPKTLADEHGLLQENDEEAIKAFAREAIDENEKAVADYKAGNENSLKFLVGQVMKKSKGAANPTSASQILSDLLS